MGQFTRGCFLNLKVTPTIHIVNRKNQCIFNLLGNTTVPFGSSSTPNRAGNSPVSSHGGLVRLENHHMMKNMVNFFQPMFDDWRVFFIRFLVQIPTTQTSVTSWMTEERVSPSRRFNIIK